MSKNVLFVDDDQRVLNAICRQFDGVMEFETAIGPEQAFEVLDNAGPLAVVVSDMQMPEMNGIEFLSRVKERSPDTVRIMLTGYADLQVTIDAVNEGNIFRFLSKPCEPELLERAVQDGIAQYRLVTAERELLEGTLHGSIKVLSELLSCVNPIAFGRTSQVQRIAMAIGQEMEITDLWNLKIATMLFPLGCVTVSESTLECAYAGLAIPENERDIFAQHSSFARSMLEKIPRLEAVAAIVGYQDKGFDGTGMPRDDIAGEEIPVGARILRAASDFEIHYKRSGDATEALSSLKARMCLYDPLVVESLENALRNGLCQSDQKEVLVSNLSVGMILASDIRCIENQQLMVTSGQRITDAIRQRLDSLYQKGVIPRTVLIEGVGKVEASNLAPV